MKDNQVVEASCLKTIKKNRVVVGDNVDIKENEFNKGKYIITQVFPRKNIIPRPVIANIDKLLILVAKEPQIDFYLVDKLIIYCQINNIEPVIVINKCDIATSELLSDVHSQYPDLQIFEISAKKGTNIDSLKSYINDSICAVCGQSAVGKSSLINCLIPNINLQTQSLSNKISRGKHTTRVNQIFVSDNIMIADTPGFSNLELNIDYRELKVFYPEFEPFVDKCKYLDCSHIKEGSDCGVVKAVNENKINQDRYYRYIALYQKLKENWEKKYD